MADSCAGPGFPGATPPQLDQGLSIFVPERTETEPEVPARRSRNQMLKTDLLTTENAETAEQKRLEKEARGARGRIRSAKAVHHKGTRADRASVVFSVSSCLCGAIALAWFLFLTTNMLFSAFECRMAGQRAASQPMQTKAFFDLFGGYLRPIVLLELWLRLRRTGFFPVQPPILG